MNPDEFLKSIYLGDRLCVSLSFEGVGRILVGVDRISRVRGDSWSYYDAEDVIEGFIVFDQVEFCDFSIVGVIPNDWIEIVSVERVVDSLDRWKFVLSFGVVDSRGISSELLLNLIAHKVSIRTKEGGILDS